VRFGENELDVTCGTGVVTPARQSGTGRVVGLDLNADMLRVARGIAHVENVRLSGVKDAVWLFP
jgi:ubiquinone/menaquinone biosynthesis C-methylase UbiE